MEYVELKNITKSYSGKNVVDNLSLSIKEGEFVTLLGPSGCGKTTVLKLIAGLEDISVGDIFVDNVLYNDIATRHRGLGMVFQSYALFPHMTVDQNIAFGLKIKKMDSLDIFDKIEWIKSLLNLSEKGKSLPAQLSGGERQRVALGRALVLEPKVLLLDEPLSNLDQEFREVMITELKRIHQSIGGTMIYVTHNQMEAMRMSDRIAVIKNGEIVQFGTPSEIYSSPATTFIGGFIGSPQMNILEIDVDRTDENCSIKIGDYILNLQSEIYLNIKENYKSKKIVWGIRPQNLKVVPKEKEKISKRSTDTIIKVIVEVVENLGDTLLIGGTVDNNRINFTMLLEQNRDGDGFNFPLVGDELKLIVDGRKMHFFDVVTGKRIV